MIRTVSFAVLMFLTTVAVAAPVPVESFAKLPEFRSVSLSPTGEYLAATVPRGNRTGIIVVNIDSMEAMSAKDFGSDTHVLGVRWVSNDRLIGEIGENYGALEQPSSAGELFA
ncbi:hypothetical protein, partial [uncultured Abyssibacter sp.]|uniref:hypothetical protein n=1 Tax=uncultured Abyssibacter sp. TaxID=2320202 RepID=UPI0032B19431